MTNDTTALSKRPTARLAGFLYFLVAISGYYGFMYVQPQLTAGSDAAATAGRMVANESLFRMQLATGVITNMLFVVVVLLLYQLFKGVNAFQARWMAVLILFCFPVGFLDNALEITALRIFKGELLGTFPTGQAQELGLLLMKVSQYSTQVLTLLWGLWLIPLALLVYRSGFIPRVFGVLLAFNGLGYVIQCFTFLLFPAQLPAVLKVIFPIYFTGEIPFIFWLLIKGVKAED